MLAPGQTFLEKPLSIKYTFSQTCKLRLLGLELDTRSRVGVDDREYCARLLTEFDQHRLAGVPHEERGEET